MNLVNKFIFTQGLNSPVTRNLTLYKITSLFKSFRFRLISSIIIFSLVILGVGVYLLSTKLPTSIRTQPSRTKAEIAPPKATLNINKELLFPLKDAKGQEVSKLKYILQSAQLQDEIVVKGQRATSIKGREFLVFNLKIVNDYTKPIQVNTRDYVRLVVYNNESDLLAPDVHNDPVEIQAKSTKYTRVGYAINESDENKLKLKVGEIDGKKENIDLKF